MTLHLNDLSPEARKRVEKAVSSDRHGSEERNATSPAPHGSGDDSGRGGVPVIAEGAGTALQSLPGPGSPLSRRRKSRRVSQGPGLPVHCNTCGVSVPNSELGSRRHNEETGHSRFECEVPS